MRNRRTVAGNRMPLRTRVFATAFDHFGGESVVGLDLPGIRRRRARVTPAIPPLTWITGPVVKDVRRQDTTFPARDGCEVPLRVYRPARSGEPLPVVVFFHGGGWVLGNTRTRGVATALALPWPVTAPEETCRQWSAGSSGTRAGRRSPTRR